MTPVARRPSRQRMRYTRLRPAFALSRCRTCQKEVTYRIGWTPIRTAQTIFATFVLISRFGLPESTQKQKQKLAPTLKQKLSNKAKPINRPCPLLRYPIGTIGPYLSGLGQFKIAF